jgi:hypothetical protein
LSELSEIIYYDILLRTFRIYNSRRRNLNKGEFYKYLGINQSNHIQHSIIKENLEKQFYLRIKSILKSKLNGNNLIKAVNTYAVPLLTYSFGVIKWSKTNLQNSIHVNSTLEPNGLSRDDGKRPDGMTLVPWNKGQPLVWDVTVVDTLADSYVLKTSEVSGFAAEMACKRKHNKYRSIISSNYIFKGLAFETLGPWCKETIDLINVIGDRLIAESGDSKSKKFLFERISLAIQRGNAASIRGTFPDSALLSEIFAL